MDPVLSNRFSTVHLACGVYFLYCTTSGLKGLTRVSEVIVDAEPKYISVASCIRVLQILNQNFFHLAMELGQLEYFA